MLWNALDILEQSSITPDVNIKVVLDFEEELGSPNLPDAVKKHSSEISADYLIIMDGPRHPSNEPTLSFGARGIQTITLKVYGPKTPQHSGHYGNYIPNPALRLSQLLASMKDENGKVIIPGYYDNVNLDSADMELLRAVPDDEDALKKQIGFVGQDSIAPFLQASIQYPSLNIRGLKSGWVGDEVRTIVPEIAIAEIDIRLVKSSDPERLINLIKTHIKDQDYHILNDEPTDEERYAHEKLIKFSYEFSYGAYKTDINSTIGQWLSSALERTFDKTPILKPTSGGSIPISPFVNTLGIPAVTVPTVNADNNQHSPNENLRLGNFKEGIQTIIGILTQPSEILK